MSHRSLYDFRACAFFPGGPAGYLMMRWITHIGLVADSRVIYLN